MHKNSKKDGKADPQHQGAGHVAGFGFAVAAIAHHEVHGRTQADEDRNKR
jgi:hypothetical protein